MVNPIHNDNRKDLKDYIDAMRKLMPDNPRASDYKERVRAWQKLLNVGRKWQVARNQEDFDPELAKLFDELGKAISRRK